MFAAAASERPPRHCHNLSAGLFSRTTLPILTTVRLWSNHSRAPFESRTSECRVLLCRRSLNNSSYVQWLQFNQLGYKPYLQSWLSCVSWLQVWNSESIVVILSDPDPCDMSGFPPRFACRTGFLPGGTRRGRHLIPSLANKMQNFWNFVYIAAFSFWRWTSLLKCSSHQFQK